MLGEDTVVICSVDWVEVAILGLASFIYGWVCPRIVAYGLNQLGILPNFF